MAQEVALGLKLDGSQADQSVSSLKKQLREAQNEVANLSDKFGATSKQAIEAAKSAAILKDKIGDAKALTDAFNPDAKFTALTKSLSGVAGGFSALQGSIALFGNESEELQKQLLKVQAAMAFSNGIQQVGESIDSFKQLGAVIKSQVVGAFTTLRGAIAATGIGALVVGVGLLIANFDKVKEAVLNAIPGLATFGKFIGGLVQKVTDFVGVTSDAARALDKIKRANDAANSSLDSTIKILEAQGGREDEVYKLKQQRIENERKGLVDQLKAKGDLNDKEREQLLKLNTDLAVLDAGETARKTKVLDDRKKEADRLAKEAAAEADARRAAEYQKELDDQNKILKLISDRQKARLGGDTGTINQDELSKAAQELKDSEDKADEDRAEKTIARQQKVLGSMKSTLFEGYKTNEAITAANISLTEKEAAAKEAAIAATTTALTNLSVIAGKDTVAGKALAIAAATINTYQGITASLKAGGFLGIAQAVAVGAAGFAAIKNIIATKIPNVPGVSGGGGSIPAPIPAPLTPTVSRASIDQAAVNDAGNAAGRQTTVIRAIAVTGQITSEQEAEERLRRGARLGP